MKTRKVFILLGGMRIESLWTDASLSYASSDLEIMLTTARKEGICFLNPDDDSIFIPFESILYAYIEGKESGGEKIQRIFKKDSKHIRGTV